MKIEYRVVPVTRYLVTKHRIRDDGSTATGDMGVEVETLRNANFLAEALASREPFEAESGIVSVVPFNEAPGRAMRCKVVLADKRPNVMLAYVPHGEKPPGRYTEEPYSYPRGKETIEGVSMKLDPTDPANYRQDGVSLAFSAVWGGQAADGKNACTENRIFADATPCLSFSAVVRNASVTDQLEPGQEYYVDFIPAPKSVQS